jgi:DNA-binding response OmpR family regulator
VDAVIIDIGLPDRKGDGLVHEIRAIYPSLPVVIASGREQENLRSQFKDLPLISVVKKPYTADALRAALRAVGIGRSIG